MRVFIFPKAFGFSSELTDQMEIEPDRLSTVIRKFFFNFTAIFFSDQEKNFSHDFKIFQNFNYIYWRLDLLKIAFVISTHTTRWRRCIGVKLVYHILRPEKDVL